MADIADVEQAVAETVTSILYPAGFAQSSIVGVVCRIYRGWPNPATLNADLSTGAVNVTIVSDNDSGRTTTRYLPELQTISSQPGVAAIAVSQTINVFGSPRAGDVIGALIDQKAFVYRIQAGDTTGLVTSNLCQLIQASFPATAHGPIITVPGSFSVEVRVVCDSSTSFESRRQEKNLRVICWCPAPQVRDSVAAAIDAAIDRISFLALPDDTEARVVYQNTASYDQAQNALLYRRDLIYMIEYPTVTVVWQPSMVFGASNINGNITYG